MNEKRHDCIANRGYDIYFAFDEWRIDSNDDSYYGIYDITYCPFCGIKLEKVRKDNYLEFSEDELESDR